MSGIGKMKLMIFGYARHGKDTAAEMLTKHFGLSAMSSSLFAMQRVMVPYFERIGVVYPSLDACYADRVNHRKEWFDEIVKYNTPDLARLGRELFAQYDIYTGVRNRHEFDAVKAEKLFDYSIWIDRSKHFPPEEKFSNTVLPEMADYVVDNNGTLKELEAKMVNLVRAIAGGDSE